MEVFGSTSGVWIWHGRLRILPVQIKVGILLDVEVKSCSGLLRSLFCLWHSLFSFDLLFSFLICLTNKEVVVKGLQTCLGVWHSSLPFLLCFLQAWQTAFFLLAGSRQNLKEGKFYHMLSLNFLLFLCL